MSMYDEMFQAGLKKAKNTIWIFSDLQQKNYENAKSCLDTCINDYEALNTPADMIWYLGDSTEGSDLNELYRMTKLQEDAFSKYNIPLVYATGNHDYDYADYCHNNGISDFKMPFYEMVQNHEGWITTKSMEDTYFKLPLGNFMVYFFSEHIAKDNSWCATHNKMRYGYENYPYKKDHFDSIREDMMNCDKKYIITAGHCAFPGGNRETMILSKIQPIPRKARLHLYGHSHIGEYKCPKERIYSQIQWIDWQDTAQVDVASFENIRGSFCRSCFLQIYEDDTLGLFFRNHDKHEFYQAFFPSMESAEDEEIYVSNYINRKEVCKAPWDNMVDVENIEFFKDMENDL